MSVDTVKCMNCGFTGSDDDLAIIEEDGEKFEACPMCKTDAYLSDLSEEE